MGDLRSLPPPPAANSASYRAATGERSAITVVAMGRAAVLLLMNAVTVVAVGYCNDKDISCSVWAKDGECTGDNGDHVKTVCPHSCATCTLVCGDLDESCGTWAKEGECASSPEYMHKNCPTSCGFCSPKCADLHPECSSWAVDGQCEQNPGFMTLNCAVACGICTSGCKDRENDCPGWAREGECKSNPGHLLKTCPVSCGISKCHSNCADRNQSACIAWSLDDQCAHNPEFMLDECPMTCGVCVTVCQNKHLNRDCEVSCLCSHPLNSSRLLHANEPVTGMGPQRRVRGQPRHDAKGVSGRLRRLPRARALLQQLQREGTQGRALKAFILRRTNTQLTLTAQPDQWCFRE